MPEKNTLQNVSTEVGVGVSTLAVWRNRYDDAPVNDPETGEDLKAWREWMKARGLPRKKTSEIDGMPDATLEEKRAAIDLKRVQIEKHEEQIKIMRGQYIPRDEIERQLAPLVAEFQNMMRERDIELSNWCPGHKTGEIRIRMRDTLDDVFKRIRDGVTDLVDSAQRDTQKRMAGDGTGVNSPGAGRPKEKNSRRSKATAKKAAKKRTAKKK